jgi:hypothetical protein
LPTRFRFDVLFVALLGQRASEPPVSTTCIDRIELGSSVDRIAESLSGVFHSTEEALLRIRQAHWRFD